LYYTPTGKLAVSVSKNGETVFSLNGGTITKDVKGNVVQVTKNIKGTNLIEISNALGEVKGYQETGFGGKVVREYDQDKNLTKTINYTSYGKKITSVVNELSKATTVYDDRGLATYETDYEGNRTAKYEYDDKNRITAKTDIYGNVTHFSENGETLYVEDKRGVVLNQYNYKYDKDGNYILDSSYEPLTGDTTYFEDGRQTVVKNAEGAVIGEFFWTGTKLTAFFNKSNGETTWYDVAGKSTYTTFGDQVVAKDLYYKGQFVGVWDERTKQATIFYNERRELVLNLEEWGEPTAEDIKTKLNQSSFVGYFPADDPKYSCIVVIYATTKHAGEVACPVFKDLADRVMGTKETFADKKEAKPNLGSAIANLNSTKSDNKKIVERCKKDNIVPSVMGKTAKEAMYILGNLGIKVTIEGKGRVVSQSIDKGTSLKKINTINLKLR
jgi:YD repeat-containing protein